MKHPSHRRTNTLQNERSEALHKEIKEPVPLGASNKCLSRLPVTPLLNIAYTIVEKTRKQNMLSQKKMRLKIINYGLALFLEKIFSKSLNRVNYIVKV